MEQFYKAIREGWDGRQVRKVGEVFLFAGPRGSWMLPCDAAGNVTEGEAPPPQREVRFGASVGSGKGATRNELREQLKAAGIPFKATAGAEELARTLKEHQAKEKESPGGPPSNPVPPGGGTGDQDVI